MNKKKQQQLLFDSYFQELVFIGIVTIFKQDYTQSQKIFVYATRMSNFKDMAFSTPILKI